MAPLEPWEKVLVDAETFPQTVHGHIACTDCHGGVQSAEKDTAHTGLVARPSDGDPNVCTNCHADVSAVFANSLHATLQGYQTVLETRSSPENHACPANHVQQSLQHAATPPAVTAMSASRPAWAAGCSMGTCLCAPRR